MQPIEVRPGKWGTKNQRTALITHSIEVNDAPQPGMEPVKRKVFVGKLFKADGVTTDTEMMWEPDGRHRTHLGVATQFDLNQAIALDPLPEVAPVAQADPNADVIRVLASAQQQGETVLSCALRLANTYDVYEAGTLELQQIKYALGLYLNDGEDTEACLKRILASFVNVGEANRANNDFVSQATGLLFPYLQSAQESPLECLKRVLALIEKGVVIPADQVPGHNIRVVVEPNSTD